MPTRFEIHLRHALHYWKIADVANILYEEGGESVLHALELFDREWPNIQAGQAWTAVHIEHSNNMAAQLCSKYPNVALRFLDLRLHPRERRRWSEAALAAARTINDRRAEGMHLSNLASAHCALGNIQQAMGYYEQSLAIARESGERRNEAGVLNNLGSVYRDFLEDPWRAIGYFEQVLTVAQEVRDQAMMGHVLSNLGSAYYTLSRIQQEIELYDKALESKRHAVRYFEQAPEIARESGNRREEGAILGSLGSAYYELNELNHTRQAIDYYEQALAIIREIGDRATEWRTLSNLGIAYQNLGDARRAIDYYEQALTVAEEIGNPMEVAEISFKLATLLFKQGREAKALDHAKHAALAFGRVGRIRRVRQVQQLIGQLHRQRS